MFYYCKVWYPEVRPHDRRSLTSTLMSIIDHQSRNSIAIVNHRSWIVNFSTIDRRSPIVTFTIDRRSSIMTVKNYYKKQSKKLLNHTCPNCKRKWFVGLFECFFGQLPSKVCGQMALWHKSLVFPNQFDHYCLLWINYFLRNEGRGSQKRTFARRQWAQYLLFFVFLSPS